MANFTPQELDSLHKLASLDANGKTFAPGTPGRSLLILMMDVYAALDDEGRKKFDRRFKRFLAQMTVPVSFTNQKVLSTWTYELSQEV